MTLRRIREGFRWVSAADIPLRSLGDVLAHMEPYAERETATSFWLLPLNSQHQLIGAGSDRDQFCAAIVEHAVASHPLPQPPEWRPDAVT